MCLLMGHDGKMLGYRWLWSSYIDMFVMGHDGKICWDMKFTQIIP